MKWLLTSQGHQRGVNCVECPALPPVELAGADYTQFPSQDSGLFGPNPWKIFAPPTNYLAKMVSGQPNPWNKSCEGESCDGNWV